VAIVVNGELIEDILFLEEFRHLGGQSIDLTHPGAAHELDRIRHLSERRVLRNVLLRQRAIAAGFTVTPEEIIAERDRQWGTSSASVCSQVQAQSIEHQLLIEKYCQWLTRHGPRPSRAEVERFYTEHRENFRTSEQVEAAHIICNIERPEDEPSARDRIAQAEEQLNRGVAFPKVADRFSDCGGKATLGWIERGAMVDEFDDVIFALKPGQRSPIFRTVFGLHIAMVLRRKPAGYQPLEDLRPNIARHLLDERKNRTIAAATEEAYRSAKIEGTP
jgi:peptidyl-prolyl cis-trans isomerase C